MKHRNAKGCARLGKRLRAHRKSREESLQDVADAVKSSKSHIWNLESGREPNPTIGLLMAIAKHFNTSVDALVRP